MTELARSGSVLVAEIKAVHTPQEGTNGDAAMNGDAAHTNGDVPHANGGVVQAGNGDAATADEIHPKGSVLGTATDAGAAPAIDPTLTSPKEHSQLSHGDAAAASGLTAGTGAVALNRDADLTADAVPATGTTDAASPQPSQLNTAVPAASSTNEPTSALSATSPTSVGQDQPHQNVDPAVAAATGATGATAGAAGVAGATAASNQTITHPAPTSLAATEAPKSALNPKEAKKMDKLMKTEAKNEQKSIKRAIKDAASSEKLFRKSRDAEAQAMKRHQKAQTTEHKAAQKLNAAKAEYEKCAAELQKALDDLDIKKKHTQGTRENYEKAKLHIDDLRAQKTVNDAARSRQSAQLHGGRA